MLQEKLIDDYCNVESGKHLSDSWKGFTKFTLLKEKPPKGHVVREEIDNNSNTKMVSKRDIASEKNSKTMYCWKVESHEIHEAASGIFAIQSSQRSHGRKRIDFDDTLQFGAQVYSDATSDENSRCRSCRGQGMERARSKSQHGIWKKSREKRRFVWNHKETNITSSLLHWWTYFHFKNAELEPKVLKYKRQSRVPVRHCKRRLWSQCCFYWTGLVCVSEWLPQKVLDVVARLPGCDGQAGGLQYLPIFM